MEMKLFSKATLDNSWFWVCVGLLISVTITTAFFEIRRDREETLREFSFLCPDGFINWENTEFEITNRFEMHGDSLIDFEKRIRYGCRPFDFTGVSREAVDSLIAAHNVIHYIWIQGQINQSKGVLLKADTTCSTKIHKYR
jgi:hypothetical protein